MVNYNFFKAAYTYQALVTMLTLTEQYAEFIL